MPVRECACQQIRPSQYNTLIHACVQTGTPRTHRRYLSRADGTYGPIPVPGRPPLGMLSLPFNTTDVPGLYCVGDSCFPGQVSMYVCACRGAYMCVRAGLG